MGQSVARRIHGWCQTYPRDETTESQTDEALLAEGHLAPLDGRNNQVDKYAFEYLILLESLQ